MVKITREVDLAFLAIAEDSPDSFASFYELLFNTRPPEFVVEEWIKPLYEAREKGKGIVIEAFRGSKHIKFGEFLTEYFESIKTIEVKNESK